MENMILKKFSMAFDEYLKGEGGKPYAPFLFDTHS